ncbi:unnamed protein product [Closterium sp. NIES-54]
MGQFRDCCEVTIDSASIAIFVMTRAFHPKSFDPSRIGLATSAPLDIGLDNSQFSSLYRKRVRQQSNSRSSRARVAGVVEVVTAVVEVAAGVVVGAAKEAVAAVRLLAGVGTLVAVVKAAVGVAEQEAVGLVAVGLALGVSVLGVASTCGRLHTQHRFFSRLNDAWHAEFGDDVELPRWADLLKSRIAIFDLDFDAILFAMFALSVSAEGDCYRCVSTDPGIAAAALGASESGTLPGTAPAEALHTFTLDSGASRCFFRDSTTLTPLPAPVPIRLADPSKGPVVARSSTVLPCPATLLWHHRLGHPPLPRLRGMHSRLLVSGLPRSLPPLPPSPAPPCLPCVEGRQRHAPHSSSFPSTTAPLQTLHMDVWGPARVYGQGRERYFQQIVDDYTRYTIVFPLRSKEKVVDVLIPWIHTVRLQLRERFCQDLLVMRLHSDRGGEFSSTLLRDFCRGEGILHSFTLPDSPQQNGIAERRIGLVMEVARTSMIHAAAPHFLWPFAVRYAAHQLNLWPRVSLPETLPTLHWTGEVGDASVFWDVTFDESVPFYRLFPYRSAPPPLSPLFLAPGPPPVDPLPPQGPAPSGVSQVDPLPGPAPVQVAVDSGAARGAASGGAEPVGAESEGVETRGPEPGGVGTRGAELGDVAIGGAKPWGAASEGAESGGAEPQGATSFGGSAGASPRLSPQQLREWLVRHTRLRSGASGAGGASAAGAGGDGVVARAGVTGGTATTGPGGARTRGTGAAGTGGVEGAGARFLLESGTTGAGGAGAGGAGVGGLSAGGAGVGGPGVGGAGARGAGAVDPGCTVRPRLYFVPLLQQPASPLPAPSPYTEHSGGLTERREPASRPVSPVRTARRVPHSRPPPIPGTHAMTLRPSSVPLRVPLPAPPESSLLEVPDPESDRARTASPTVSCLLATAVTDPSFDPPSVGGECALGTDDLEDRQEDFECLAATVPRFASMLLTLEGDPDAPNIPTPCSYEEAITGSPPAFKTRYVARGFSQRQGVDYFHTFSPTPKMTTLRVLLHVTAHLDYELHSLDFSTAFLHGSLHEEIWLRRPPCISESFLADPSLFLRTDTSLPPFYVLVNVNDLVFATSDTVPLTLVLQRFGFHFSSPHPTPLSTIRSLSAPPSDESVEPSGPYEELVGCLMVLRYLCSTSGMGLVLGGRGPVVLTGHADAFSFDDSATQRSSQGYTFSLVLYVDNKAMIALCQEHRLEHRMKHIALRYFLARELQQRGQLRLAYVATRANTADVFTKALPPGDHQRFSTLLLC